MKRIIAMFVGMALFVTLPAYGQESQAGHDTYIERAQEIIAVETPCEELSNEDFEALGEYFMEQTHPGEQHEVMDQMMGGEGSASLEVAHSNMGRAFYCGQEYGGMMTGSAGMMGGMPALSGVEGMGGYGMMNNYYGKGITGYDRAERHGGEYMGSMMGLPFGDFGFGSMFLGGLWMFLFWGLVILGVVWLVQFLARSNKGNDAHQDPMRIVKERFAKGEINEKQFEEMKKTLK